MSRRSIELTDGLYDYLLQVSLRESPLFARLRKETAKLPGAAMQISPEQGQVMGLLVELIGAGRAIEIGTFTGYSALAVATALPTNGKLISCDVDEETSAIARRYWTEAIRKLNAKLQGDDRIALSMLPVGDGLTLARVRG
jgi:predicted O-methyltransferase YrrM